MWPCCGGGTLKKQSLAEGSEVNGIAVLCTDLGQRFSIWGSPPQWRVKQPFQKGLRIRSLQHDSQQ